MIREGTCNFEKFLEFLCFLIFKYIELGFKKMLFVIDQSSYHKKAMPMKIGETLGIELMWFYLPKQSPWLNPLEAEWKIFRKLPLRKFKDKQGFVDLYTGFLRDRGFK